MLGSSSEAGTPWRGFCWTRVQWIAVICSPPAAPSVSPPASLSLQTWPASPERSDSLVGEAGGCLMCHSRDLLLVSLPLVAGPKSHLTLRAFLFLVKMPEAGSQEYICSAGRKGLGGSRFQRGKNPEVRGQSADLGLSST